MRIFRTLIESRKDGGPTEFYSGIIRAELDMNFRMVYRRTVAMHLATSNKRDRKQVSYEWRMSE